MQLSRGHRDSGNRSGAPCWSLAAAALSVVVVVVAAVAEEQPLAVAERLRAASAVSNRPVAISSTHTSECSLALSVPPTFWRRGDPIGEASRTGCGEEARQGAYCEPLEPGHATMLHSRAICDARPELAPSDGDHDMAARKGGQRRRRRMV